MDVVALVREEWSTLLLAVGGSGGLLTAAGNGDWTWAVTCFALLVMCLRVLQLRGYLNISV